MAIDFPASPTLNQTFSVGNTNYVWDGTKWTASVTGGIALDKIQEGNTSAEAIDTGSDGRFVVTTEGTERLRVDSSGRLGIGTSSASAPLDVVGSANTVLLSSNATDATTKEGKVQCRHYSNAEENLLMIYGYSTATENGVALGGLSGQQNAATVIQFLTAANNTTTIGTERLRISNTGAIGLSGANYGTSGQVLTSQGSGAAPQWATPGGAAKYAVIADRKAQGTSGGTFTAGAWRTRDLNTEISDPDGIVSISSNQFTLNAGTYVISWLAPVLSVDLHQSQLYNVTTSSTAVLGTSSVCYVVGNSVTAYSHGAGVVTLGGTSAFEIRHITNQTQASYGFGLASNFGTEQYTTVQIIKL